MNIQSTCIFNCFQFIVLLVWAVERVKMKFMQQEQPILENILKIRNRPANNKTRDSFAKSSPMKRDIKRNHTQEKT